MHNPQDSAPRLEMIHAPTAEEIVLQDRLRRACDAQECYWFTGAMAMIAGAAFAYLALDAMDAPLKGFAAAVSIQAGVYGLVVHLRLAKDCQKDIDGALIELNKTHWKGW